MIVMCDQQWLDPDLDARNGIMMAKEKDMLRLDSMIMMAQLNVRELLEVRTLTAFKIYSSCIIHMSLLSIPKLMILLVSTAIPNLGI